MKDHEIAKIVTELRDIAKEFGATQQLRNRISGYIVPILRGEGIPSPIQGAELGKPTFDDMCEHGALRTGYCEPCGRVHSA